MKYAIGTYEQGEFTAIDNTKMQKYRPYRAFKVGRYLVPVSQRPSELELDALLASQDTVYNKHTLLKKGVDFYYTHPDKVKHGLPYEIVMLGGRIISAMVRVQSGAMSVRIDRNEIASLQLDMLTDCLTITFKK
jgi:hypothetical protein